MNERNMQHGIDWDGQDLSGWFMSEKMNGCRAFWDGRSLWTRGGLQVQLPHEWRADLPAEPLDCEIYDGPDGLYRCGDALKQGRFLPSMRLIVFDAPACQGTWSDRMRHAAALTTGSSAVTVVWWRECLGTADAVKEVGRVAARGGEGLMLRSPDLAYVAGRTNKMLKMKPHHVAEI